MNGLLYNEVVPCAKELDGVDETGRRITKYCEPPPHKEKKAVRPKLTHNPFGTFGVHGKPSTIEEALSSKLSIEGSLKEKTFLAAYLACWLCTFALPIDGVGSIHLSTFKVASIMAAGRRVGLVVPVLASVYKGLNKISGFSRLIHVPSPFPIHFVYSWIAHYFKTHYQVLQGVRGPKMTLFSGEGGTKYYDLQEARKQIHKGDFVSWTCNMIAKDKDFSFVDDMLAKDFEEAYFIAIRSNYLPLWQDDHFDVELYSPHWFARQFGFFQVPEILSQGVRRASLGDGICYWRLCISFKTMKKPMQALLKKFSSIKQLCSGNSLGMSILNYVTLLSKDNCIKQREYILKLSKGLGGYCLKRLEDNAARLLGPSPIKALPKDKERGKRIVHDSPRECVASVPPKCDSQVVESLVTSKKKSVSRPLEENESSNLDRHWKRPKRDSNISKPMNVDDDASSHALSMLNFVKELEDEVLDIKDDETSQDSQELILGPKLLVNTFPIRMGPKAKLPCHAAMSVFEGERFVLNHQREFLQKMWSDFLVKISKTPVDFVSSIQDDVRFILESMKNFQRFDISKVEEPLNALFTKVAAYGKVRSSSSEKLSKDLLERQLKEVNTCLQDGQVKESEEVFKIQTIMDELESIERKLVYLKEQRTQLCAILKGQKQFLHIAQTKVHEIDMETAALENTTPLDDEAVEIWSLRGRTWKSSKRVGEFESFHLKFFRTFFFFFFVASLSFSLIYEP
ncbi:UNVERIFIED_CONTAM: hypothetical protein Sradi_0678700 [Sesamum radiatum]|uniref:Aminotransferase-like plant mobile domain-containing protein n=1 Tax=Sesamum radiatum TaxID=300843 RepID=A0AAW2VM27_SESRA